MGALRVALASATLFLCWPAWADAVTRWRPYAAEASARFGLRIDWIERVIRVESGGNTMVEGRPIRSPAGAMGLMQLMPATWAEMRQLYKLGLDPDDPHDNIIAGAAYLRRMYNRFGYPGMFGAYNAGPGRYAGFLVGGNLPSETRAYLIAVGGVARRIARPGRTASVLVRRAVTPLFVSLSAGAPEIFVFRSLH